MNYTQLTQEQRYQISALLKMGHNRTEIATVIGKHKSTISRELSRNKGQRGYRPKQAHRRALHRRKHIRKRISAESWELIETKLCLDWSPEQVSGWLYRYHNIQVSHEWIYQHILADKQAGVICIVICAAKRSGVSAMVAMTDVAKYKSSKY